MERVRRPPRYPHFPASQYADYAILADTSSGPPSSQSPVHTSTCYRSLLPAVVRCVQQTSQSRPWIARSWPSRACHDTVPRQLVRRGWEVVVLVMSHVGSSPPGMVWYGVAGPNRLASPVLNITITTTTTFGFGLSLILTIAGPLEYDDHGSKSNHFSSYQSQNCSTAQVSSGCLF